MAETTADWHDRQAQLLAEKANDLRTRSDWHTEMAKELRACAEMDAAIAPETPDPESPCPHGRTSWRHCPHCLGINK